LVISVIKTGIGNGTVTSSLAGIDCGATCEASFINGTFVTLNVAASTGSTFTGWCGEGCAGTGTCVVTMDGAKSVNATFMLNAIDSDLIAYYPFNGNANDESGNGNNRTVIGATLTTDRFDNPNQAYSFDGVSNYINVPNAFFDLKQ
jgi:hypothetical protein